MSNPNQSNPYQTPEGQLTTDDFAYGEVKFFSPSSRINRLRYWAHSGLFSLASLVVFIFVGLIAAFVSTTVGIVLGVVVYIGVIVFSVILMIQRLHDLNKTGWMALLAIIPFANIYLFILLIFFKGTEGRNNFGLQTPPNKPWHWVAALGIPVFGAVLGIIAAVALPAYQNYVNAAQGFESSYESQDSDTYPSEYTEDGAVEDSTFSEEASDDSASYDAAEQDGDIESEQPLDETEAEIIEETESETPQ